jgi:hypothetical protein
MDTDQKNPHFYPSIPGKAFRQPAGEQELNNAGWWRFLRKSKNNDLNLILQP